MTAAISPPLLIAFVGIVFLAGIINGVAGFGFALVGTMALATIIDPAIAVVFMIIPIVAVNLSLVRDLTGPELRRCGRRFSPLLTGALIGTLVGMILIERIPANLLRVALGAISLGFVASAQRALSIPLLARTRERCYVESTPAMFGVGGIGGLLFGGTNVGVQLVAYLRSCDLSHGLFVGVVALLFLGLNSVRVGLAGALGMYSDPEIAFGSIAVAIPAAVGVAAGKRIRGGVNAQLQRWIVLTLISVIGLRLVAGGLGII